MRVFDDEDRSRVYMVMEWVDGRSLRHILTEQKKLPAERAVRIAQGFAMLWSTFIAMVLSTAI
jgi:eukaryotic-like serine/threonine-protein kinase